MRATVVVGVIVGMTTAHADSFDWAGKVERDAHGLRSDDPKRRLDAVHLLAMDNIALSQRFLLQALTDDDRSVRLEAGKALGMGGAEAAVPAFIEWLADTDPRTRTIAADALGNIGGAAAVQALTRSLGDTDPGVRQSSVKSLGKLALHDDRRASVVASLLPRLDDDKADVRRETVDQLEFLGDRRAVIPLVSRFADTSKDVAKAAVRAIGALGDRAAVPALIRMLNDADETLRRLAAQSLGRLGAGEAIDPLIDQLEKASTDSLRASIAYALGQLAAAPGASAAGEAAMRILVADLVSSRSRVAAREALRIAGHAAVPALIGQLGARGKGDLSPVVALLGEIGDARATAALISELERGRVAIPIVLRALGATRGPQALIPVLRATAQADATIRLAAMRALRPLLDSDARAGDVINERLDDVDLEVRILAAEYLGVLNVATPKLAAIAISDDAPLRLRTAAIDALGEIAAAGNAAVTPTVLADILRTGPNELHSAAATALSYLKDASALPRVIAYTRSVRGPTRHEAVRAIGGMLRGGADGAGRQLLRELVRDRDSRVAVAAVCGLAAANDLNDAPLLRNVVAHGNPELRRAAASALGDLRDIGAAELLVGALDSPDDRLAGAAAWALGEIFAAGHGTRNSPTFASLADRWLHLARYGGWAAAINAMAALGRTLWAQPSDTRQLSPTQQRSIIELTRHKSRLVRINALFALASLPANIDGERALAQRLRDDPSPHVRAAAARSLGSRHDRVSRAALETSAKTDTDRSVVAAAKAALAGPGPLVIRSEWRTFVLAPQPRASEQQVRNQPYFVHGPDGVVWATYTDTRGELSSEHIAPGTSAAHVWPADRESSY